MYGDNPKYLIGAIKNVRLAQKYMPDWECRIYIGKDVPEVITHTLKLFDNVNLIYMKFEEYQIFEMTYRFLVFSDPDVDIAIVRDLDSRISARDILAVEEWLDSGLSFHIMKDHKVGHNYLIPGCGFGARTEKVRSTKDLLIKFFQENPYHIYGADQVFLAEDIYPLIKDDCFYHTPYFDCNPTGNSIQKDFPTENRYPLNHVGAALNEEDEYVYAVDIDAAIANNGINKYEYDFDLLEKSGR